MTSTIGVMTNDHVEMDAFITMGYDIFSAKVRSGGDGGYNAYSLNEWKNC